MRVDRSIFVEFVSDQNWLVARYWVARAVTRVLYVHVMKSIYALGMLLRNRNHHWFDVGGYTGLECKNVYGSMRNAPACVFLTCV